MKTKQIIAMVVAAVLFIVIGVTNVFTKIVEHQEMALLEKEYGYTAEVMFGDLFGMEDLMEDEVPMEDFVAVLPVVGTIMSGYTALETGGYEHETMLTFIDELMDNEENQAIVLYISSPGGTVIDADEMYLKLLEYKEVTGRPVYAYVHDACYSGGYYIAMAADKIYVNRNATIGSIGVIVSTYDISGLYEKLGIEEINITSGKNKAMFTGDDAATQEQIAIYQDIVDDAFAQFTGIVEDGRQMSHEEVMAVADGSVFAASKAKELKLIDEIYNTYDDTLDAISEELSCDYYYDMPTTEESFWETLFMKAEDLIPKSEAQALSELSETMDSKGLMYYAVQ